MGTFVTLDGVMQAPRGPDEDRDGGFQHGGWLVPYFDDNFLGIMTEWTRHAGAFLLGRKTYEIFAASWPRSIDPADEIATARNTRPKFVASRTLDKVTWNNSHPAQGRRGQGSREAQERGWRRARHRQAPVRPRHDPARPRLADTQQTTSGAVLHVEPPFTDFTPFESQATTTGASAG